MKYINIRSFINLTKSFPNSELTTYLAIAVIQNSVRRFKLSDLYKILSFYSEKQIKNNIVKLTEKDFISRITDDEYHLHKRFIDLTDARNNLILIEKQDIEKYQKKTILWYKYKIFELFCKDLLSKQSRIKEILNISQDEIRQFERHFEMNSVKMSLKLKGLVKWTIGLTDRNIKESHFWYSSLPNEYVFYNNTKVPRLKVNNKYINRVRSLLAFKYISRDNDCEIETNTKPASTGKVDVRSQLVSIYTKILEEGKRYRYKIDKQLTELFPYFVNRNFLRKYYKCSLHHLMTV